MQKTNTLPTIKEDESFVVIDSLYLDDSRNGPSFQQNFPKEIFLSPTTYGQFLKGEKDKGIKHPYRETFCEGFFIASFPQKDGKVIEMSESFPAPCKHEECSKLPSMKPEIIFRYQ